MDKMKQNIVRYSEVYKIRQEYESGNYILLARMHSCKWHLAVDFFLREDYYCIVHKDYNDIIMELIK